MRVPEVVANTVFASSSSPSPSSSPYLSSYSDEDLLVLSKQKGFWGAFEHEEANRLLRWRRIGDYQFTSDLPGGLPDESTFFFEGSDVLIEEGIHEVFKETWVREPGSAGSSFHLVNDTLGLGGRKCHVFISGNIFICLFERLESTNELFRTLVRAGEGKVKSLTTAIEQLILTSDEEEEGGVGRGGRIKSRDKAEALLDMGIFYGKVVDNSDSSIRFRIELSTFPYAIGKSLIEILANYYSAPSAPCAWRSLEKEGEEQGADPEILFPELFKKV
jgi:hypothetical protein